jgi:hypothetical protein
MAAYRTPVRCHFWSGRPSGEIDGQEEPSQKRVKMNHPLVVHEPVVIVKPFRRIAAALAGVVLLILCTAKNEALCPRDT